MKNSRNLRIYLRNKILSNYNLNNAKNYNTIKNIKDKVRRTIKKNVEILQYFVSTIEQRRHFLKELSSVRIGRNFVNDTTIGGIDINDIPEKYFYSIKEKTGKNFAFDIRELNQININPYTKTPFDYWIPKHIIQEIEKRDIYTECICYPILGDLEITKNELFDIYCNFREKNEEFKYYSSDYHNNVVTAYYSCEKKFKYNFVLLCYSLPEHIREQFLSTFPSN